MVNKKLDYNALLQHTINSLVPRQIDKRTIYPKLTEKDLLKVLNSYNKEILGSKFKVYKTQLRIFLKLLLEFNIIQPMNKRYSPSFSFQKNEKYLLTDHYLNFHFSKSNFILKKNQDYIKSIIHIFYSLNLILLDSLVQEQLGKTEYLKQLQSMADFEIEYLKTIFSNMLQKKSQKERNEIMDFVFSYLNSKLKENEFIKIPSEKIHDTLQKINAEPNS